MPRSILCLPPPPPCIFERIVLKSNNNDFLTRWEEFAYYIEKYQIDVFCNHAVISQPLFYILFFKISGIPVVLESHVLFNTLYMRYHKIYQLADALVTVSRVNKTYWQNLGCNSYYIPNPIPLDILKQKSLKSKKSKQRNILWINRIDYDKQPWEIVPIMKEVVKFIPDAILNVVGGLENKPLFDQLQSYIKTESLEKNIIFHGYHLKVKPFYESADVMLVTSPAEGFSFTIAESMLMKVPIVCYELPYLELLRNGKGFISVQQNDRYGAAMAIVKILTDSNLKNKISSEAQKNIQKFIDYDILGAWKKVFDNIENSIRNDEKNFEMEQIEILMIKNILKQEEQIKQLNKTIQTLQNKI